MVLTIFDEGADLKLMSIYHKAYISLIVKSVIVNLFLEKKLY